MSSITGFYAGLDQGPGGRCIPCQEKKQDRATWSIIEVNNKAQKRKASSNLEGDGARARLWRARREQLRLRIARAHLLQM